MQELISHLFRKHITDDTSLLMSQLLNLKTLTLSSDLKLVPEDLQLLQYLIAKNIVTYSPSQLSISLNKKMILIYQRLHKIKRFAMKHYNPQFYLLVEKFISNQFLPINTSQKTLKMLIEPNFSDKSQVKSKKKKDEHHQQLQKKQTQLHGVDYSRLLFEYSSKVINEKDSENQVMINIDELTQQLKFFNVEKWIGQERGEELKNQLKFEDKRQLYLDLYDASKENTGNRIQLIKQTIAKIKKEKIEQFILQMFRRYDGQAVINEKLSSNCLLTFNCVKKYPLIGEKELIAITYLPLVVQRKCLNLLVQEGLLHFYPEGPRSLVYRIREFEQIQQLFLDRLCTSLLNLHLLSESSLAKEQLLKLECMIADLDDILLLF